MSSHKLFALAAALTALSAAGCDTANTNNANANTAVVTNANATAANTNATANDNRAANADITREEFERDRVNWEREAREAGRTIGSGANDLWLWTKTRASLAAADDLRDSTINVDVENDAVTLTGTVGTNEQKTRAEQIAHSIEGVRSVRNSLSVTGANANR